METKQHENTLLIHRPRKRRNLILDPKQDQKSQNLKVLHQTLLCEDSQRGRQQLAPERSSVAQLINGNRHYSRKQGSESSKEKERPVNFYINI